MRKTTIYLSDELHAAIKAEAAAKNCSEASLIRSTLERELNARLNPPLPLFGLFSDGSLDIENLDKELDGFGQ
jgi:hypothetical protein